MIMRNHGWLLSGVLAVLALHGFAAAAQDDDDDDDDDDASDGRGAVCSNSLGDVEVRGDLNIVARCQLTGTEIRGNVILFEGGSLIARGARIRGRLEGNRADFVAIEQSRIDGAINLQGLVGDESTLARNDIRGNTELRSNRSRFEILNNDFRRRLQATGNTGGLVISGNSIEGDLECSGNQPAP